MADLFDGTTPSHAEAAEKRAAAAAAAPDVNRGLIDALLVERHGYVMRGDRADRVAQVDAELERLGHKVERPVAEERKPSRRAASA